MENQQIEQQINSQSSSYSSEDEDAVLLTDAVQFKLLEQIAKLKRKDKSLYSIQQPLYKDEDFDEITQKKSKQQTKKFTIKEMMMEQQQQQQSNQDLPPVMQQKHAKQSFKNAFNKFTSQNKDSDNLFKIKQKHKVEEQKGQSEKFNEYIKSLPNTKNKKLVTQFWGNNENLDETDLFLKKYIIDKKWLSKKGVKNYDEKQQEQEEQMDKYQAEYNFRFQQPDGAKLVNFPRKIEQSLRIKPQTRKQKRKQTIQRKKQQEKKIRQEAKQKQQQLRVKIMDKLLNNTGNQQGNDWFFCDDCGKGLDQYQQHYMCDQCQDYILCSQCFQLIIHPHDMKKSKVPKGFGAPNQQIAKQMVQILKKCTKCRKKITPQKMKYQYLDKNYLTNILCQKCYDSANLETKKKYKPIQPQIQMNEQNIDKLLEENPQKLKEISTQEDIQKMVDQYIKQNFQDVIGGGLKTKFKYISVKPQSYGLSDQQILYGSDKQLNNYVSTKLLAPYREESTRLRNNIYNRRIKPIKKSVKQNKKLIKTNNSNALQKLRQRSSSMKEKRIIKKLKLVNISDPQKQRQIFISESRLASYGLTQ